MVKRAFDVLFSACFLALALPVLLLAAIAIKLDSDGPVLFRQARMGRGFRAFQLIKFRTMAHARGGLAYTLGADPRITRVGRWLRGTKLDEVPQFWNVLVGDMSLVGTRPVLPELAWEFSSAYRRLLLNRPGLTDPASLKYRSETEYLGSANDPMSYFKTIITPDKLRISLEYQARATFLEDLMVLAMTPMVCCFPRLSRIYGQIPPEHAPSVDCAASFPPPQLTVIRVSRPIVFPAMRDARGRRLPTSDLLRCPIPQRVAQVSSSSRSESALSAWNSLPQTRSRSESTSIPADGRRLRL